ncbi:MAG: DUF808 domain-containing protein, partial [Hydrogenovibrio sp.]|nr:DUF808 domain-containing protein [Hydrogenovibrio sp.]
MAGAGLLALIDDIASLLDDVSLMSKVAAKKTAGVLGDDLALNAQQVSGVKADRELPVVWAVAKGSFLNKLILVPLALLLSATLPWLITPLLIIGGAYLCYEGVEKLVHDWQHRTAPEHSSQPPKLPEDLVAYEKDKIKGAIRTDFILSIEIIVIVLGTVQEADFLTQVMVVSLVAIVITIGVYTLVAGIVKFDDAGLALIERGGPEGFGRFKTQMGQLILYLAPKLMKALSTIGMVAMFLVGGGILVHGVPWLHHLLQSLTADISGLLGWVLPILFHITVGLILGA